MKIWINFDFKQTSGGGNQFLSQLKDYFEKKNVYSKSINDSNIIIFNHHHKLKEIFFINRKNKLIIHRIDGPLTFHRNIKGFIQDIIVTIFAISYADLIIFQSLWTKKFFYIPMLIFKKKHCIVHNSSNIKEKYNIKTKIKNKDINILFSSFSNNKNKGFKYFEFVKKLNLNSQIKISFVGNAPMQKGSFKSFKNTSHEKYSNYLNLCDIYIFCGIFESCSNSLVEAMALNKIIFCIESGSNREILNKYDAHFFSDFETLENLIKNSKMIISRRNNLNFINVDNREKYLNLIEDQFNDSKIKHD